MLVKSHEDLKRVCQKAVEYAKGNDGLLPFDFYEDSYGKEEASKETDMSSEE